MKPAEARTAPSFATLLLAALALTAILPCVGFALPQHESTNPVALPQHESTNPVAGPRHPTEGDPPGVPRNIAHVVVVIEENHSFDDIIGNPRTPYINMLASHGALFTHAFGVEHPSQPNYLDLFSGSDQGITNDGCPHTISAPNLARSLLDAGLSFVGYSEGLPAPGFTGCTFGSDDGYHRKHNPWVDFSNVPSSANQPMTAFPSDFSALPTVAFVVPDLAHDMHNGTPAAADAWLRAKLSAYVTWAPAHHSILIVTWDESERVENNHIPLIIFGAGVSAGHYSETVNHFSVLRTIEDAFGLAPVGRSAAAKPILDIWRQ